MWYLYTDGSFCVKTRKAAGAFVLLFNDEIVEKKSVPSRLPSRSSVEAELLALSLGVFACIRRNISQVVLISDYQPASKMFSDQAFQASRSSRMKKVSKWQKGLVDLVEKFDLKVIPVQKCDVKKYHQLCDMFARSARLEAVGEHYSQAVEGKSVHIGWSHNKGNHAITAIVLSGYVLLDSETRIISGQTCDRARRLAVKLGEQLAKKEKLELVLEEGKGRKYAREIARSRLWESIA